ncbi:hypothetical protein Ancab_022147 [Ancistrocladus abbreviatus]
MRKLKLFCDQQTFSRIRPLSSQPWSLIALGWEAALGMGEVGQFIFSLLFFIAAMRPIDNICSLVKRFELLICK